MSVKTAATLTLVTACVLPAGTTSAPTLINRFSPDRYGPTDKQNRALTYNESNEIGAGALATNAITTASWSVGG